MIKKLLWAIGFAWLSGVLVGNAPADEIGELRRQVLEQNEKLKLLQEKLEQYELRRQQNHQVLARQLSELSAGPAPGLKLPDALKWAEKVKISGDFRYRHETIEAEKDDKPDRHRNRFRARVGLKAKVNEEWEAGFRFASGSEDPVSTNQTLNSSFATKGFWIDQAYFDYHPELIEGLHILGGKMSNPFYRVGKNQLIWDGDLTPEGIGARHKISLDESNEIFVNGGGFFVTESSSSDSDMSVWGAQGGLRHQFDEKTYLLSGISYYDYGNIENAGDLDVGGSSFFGNSSSSGVFVNDYDLVELFGEVGTKATAVPLSIYGNYVENTDADTEGDSGWLVGFKIN